jgi:sigma-E factor negative regulatory protein RseA
MNEKISALADGELDERAMGEAVDALRDEKAREAWAMVHLIGDAMRGTRELSSDFSARLAWRLAEEPTVLAPQRQAVTPAQAGARRWLAPMPLAASLAAVALVGWLAFAPQPEIAPVAKVAAPVIAKAEDRKPVIVPLPASTNDYLLAHQGFSPRLSLQGMAPYVITVSEQPRK